MKKLIIALVFILAGFVVANSAMALSYGSMPVALSGGEIPDPGKTNDLLGKDNTLSGAYGVTVDDLVATIPPPYDVTFEYFGAEGSFSNEFQYFYDDGSGTAAWHTIFTHDTNKSGLGVIDHSFSQDVSPIASWSLPNSISSLDELNFRFYSEGMTQYAYFNPALNGGQGNPDDSAGDADAANFFTRTSSFLANPTDRPYGAGAGPDPNDPSGYVTTSPGTYFFFDDNGDSNDDDHDDMVVRLSIETDVVPEPATMFLLGVGLLGLAVINRKRFKK